MSQFIKRIRPRYTLGVLVAGSAIAAGSTLVPNSAEAKGGFIYNSNCVLKSIATDQNGVIEVVEYSTGANPKPIALKGCGAKIANLPHLVEALQLNRTIDLSEENACLKGVKVYKP